MDIELLKKQNKLTVNKDGLIYIKPLEDNSYITYPIENLGGCLALTPEQYVLLKADYYRITKDLKGIEINKIEDTE